MMIGDAMTPLTPFDPEFDVTVFDVPVFDVTHLYLTISPKMNLDPFFHFLSLKFFSFRELFIHVFKEEYQMG